MWLLNVHSIQLEEILDESQRPPYAILSHRWRAEEVSFAELSERRELAEKKLGFVKIRKCCNVVKSQFQLDYVWVDTCCIDKRNSADLQEAINSMYSYYEHSTACIVYLDDVKVQPLEPSGWFTALKHSEWFKRGWTLQELLASKSRSFYGAEWTALGTCHSMKEHTVASFFHDAVSKAAHVPLDVLLGRKKVEEFCIAHRMSWAAPRRTTRPEDISYSLMGLFRVNIPILYGEGAAKAFERLQQEILKSSFDQSIFVWRRPSTPGVTSSGLLASSPAHFMDTPEDLFLGRPGVLTPIAANSLGLTIHTLLLKADANRTLFDMTEGYFAIFPCAIPDENYHRILAIVLQEIPGASVGGVSVEKLPGYRRVKCSEWFLLTRKDLKGRSLKTIPIVVLGNEQYELFVQTTVAAHARRGPSLTDFTL